MRAMKKTASGLLAGLLIWGVASLASAAGIADWNIRSGNVNGQMLPIEAEVQDDGIVLRASGYYTPDGAAEASAQSVTYQTPVDVNAFAAELAIEQVASDYAQGGDSWISLSLLNSQAFFNVANPNDGAGFVALLRDNGGKLELQTFILDSGGFTPAKIEQTAHSTKGPFSMEFKRDEQANTWHLYVNGEQFDTGNEYAKLAPELFADGKAYFTVGAADRDFGTNVVKLLSVNGNALGTGGSAEGGQAVEAAAVANPNVAAANPKTSDGGWLPYGGAAVVAGILLLLLSARPGRRSRTVA